MSLFALDLVYFLSLFTTQQLLELLLKNIAMLQYETNKLAF